MCCVRVCRHIIEDQLAIVQQDLPRNYYYELPKLSSGVLRGYPRVYAISLIMVAYTDSLVDFDTLARFVQAYQRVCPLLIGELWAVAITLRIVLFEQLRLLAVRLGDTMTQLQRANRIADELLLMVSRPSITASDIVQQLSSNLGPQQELHRTLIVQLTQRLRDQDPIIRPAFSWLETQLSERYHTTTANVIQMDHHAQAADQVTIQNIVQSYRMVRLTPPPHTHAAVRLSRAVPPSPSALFRCSGRSHSAHNTHPRPSLPPSSLFPPLRVKRTSVPYFAHTRQ